MKIQSLKKTDTGTLSLFVLILLVAGMMSVEAQAKKVQSANSPIVGISSSSK